MPDTTRPLRPRPVPGPSGRPDDAGHPGPAAPAAVDPTDVRATGRTPVVRPDDPLLDPLLDPLAAPDTGPARDWADATGPRATGPDRLAPPDALPDGDLHLEIVRTFCFADLCGFTAFTREHGPHEAVRLLGEFRRLARDVAAKRGVRVAKWLGDGVMVVGVEPAPTLAFGAHLIAHFASRNPGPPAPVPSVRVGAATGVALLFEGDDYIGEPVNLAAKLCAAAEPGEMLAVCDLADLPEWVRAVGDVPVLMTGIGAIGGVHRLVPVPTVPTVPTGPTGP